MLKRILFVAVILAGIWCCLSIAQEKVAEEKVPFTADIHKDKGTACDACHKTQPPKALTTSESCLACHKSLEAVAEKTQDYSPNPHKNHLTDSQDVDCLECHHGHKADTPKCTECHGGMTFEKK